MPVLSQFYAEHPDINVKFIVGSSTPVADPDVDGAIGIGQQNSGSFLSEPLVSGDLALVCSPEYLKTNKPPEDVAALRYHTLLRSSEFARNWEVWLGDDIDEVFSKARFIDFESAGLDITAATEGLGIAIVRQNLIKTEIELGQLVTLLEQNVVRDQYSFFYSDTKLHSDKFKRFRRWLKMTIKG